MSVQFQTNRATDNDNLSPDCLFKLKCFAATVAIIGLAGLAIGMAGPAIGGFLTGNAGANSLGVALGGTMLLLAGGLLFNSTRKIEEEQNEEKLRAQLSN